MRSSGFLPLQRILEQWYDLRPFLAGSRVNILFFSLRKVTPLASANSPPRTHHLIRLPPASVAQAPEVRCAVVGNVDSGKSTTLGVLSRGALDDGRGKARVGLFRHKHEIESGRTSSVGMEVSKPVISVSLRY